VRQAFVRRAPIFFVAFLLGLATSARAQPAPDDAPPPQAVAGPAYTPATIRDRVNWTVGGTIGPRSLFAVGPLAAAWQTGFNQPSEWGRSWSGFGKRYLEREADVAISNTIEAGLGAIWGEEPRYVRSGRHGIGARARYAIETAFVAQRRDGHLAPAWGRYAGNVFNNLIENTWLPPSATTPGQTVARSLLGLASRIGGNAWEEFWPDAKRLLEKRRP
jgi:hypothetical protein